VSDFLATPRRSTSWVTRIVAVLVLALLAALAFRLATTDKSAATPPVGSASPSVDGVASPPGTPPAEPLRLVRGGKTVDGIQVEYPRSTAGAVSAAVEYWTQLGSTLDSGRARTIAKQIAVRSWTTAGDELAQGPANTRRHFGLPAQGQLPPGAAVSLGPVAYQLRDDGNERTTVLLLGYLISTTPVGTKSTVGVFPAPLRWDDGDWRIEPSTGSADYRSLAKPPGSPEAAAAGWLDFLQ
jgi:hypothetical protein